MLQTDVRCDKITVRKGWLVCPTCGNRRMLRIDDTTEARGLPVYCRRCKSEIIVDIDRGQSARRQSQS